MSGLDRAIHFDFHTMPGVTGFLKDFDAGRIAAKLKKANVTYVNVAARCNIGFSYYKTEVGFRYPGMKGDMLKELIGAMHAEGIGVTAYLNGGINHELLVRRPELSKINSDGSIMQGDRVWDNFFRSPCFNTEYRNYLKEEIREILEYKPDGIFLDCMIPKACYCPECMKKMQERGLNPNSEEDAQKYAYDLITEVCYEVKDIVGESARLYINSFPYEAIAECESHVELECLPTDGMWGYDYFGVLAPYYRNFSNDRVYMTGRFVDGWGDFGGVKSAAALENDMYDALLQGYGISVGDHMHPHGTIDDKLYSVIEGMYDFKKSIENYTNGAEFVSDVCVIRNKMNYKNAEQRMTRSDRGACRMLSELKILYDIKNEDMDLSGYRLLVLPDGIEITDKLYKKLCCFEGAVLSCGKSIGEGDRWEFVRVLGEDGHADAFYKTEDGAVRACYAPSVLMKSTQGISPYIEPYFDRIYDGRHGYFYIPPKGETEYCAIATDGRTAHICFDIFRAYYERSAEFHRKTVAGLISALLKDKSLIADELPVSVRVSLQKNNGKTMLLIKTTYPEFKGAKGIVDEHTVLPAGRKVCVLGEFLRAYSVRKNENVEISYNDGYSSVVLPEICGFDLIVLE